MSEQVKSILASPQEKSAVFLMSEFYRLINLMKKVKKTLIIYDIYQEGKKRLLVNLQSIAAGILSDSIKMKGDVEEDPKTQKKTRYHYIDIQQIQKVVKVDYIKVHQDSDQSEERNIRLYLATVNGESVRVVTVPIEKNLTDKTQIEQINAKILQIDETNHTIKRNLQGEALRKFIQDADFLKKKITQQFCGSMRQKHLKMFNIEALLYVIRQKTQYISVCGIKNVGSSDQNYQKELVSLFDVPNQAKQFIIHSVISDQSLPDLEKKAEISSIWTFSRSQKPAVACVKNECWAQRYFTKETKNIKTKIYRLMSEGNNEYLATVIEEFIKNWNNITVQASTCVVTVIRRVYESLQYGEDLSTSSIMDSSKSIGSNKDLGKDQSQTIIAYTFDEIFRKYEIKKNGNLRQNQALQQFYTPRRLENIHPEKGEKVIPETIEHLTFLHYFYKINRQFCENYANWQKQDYESFLGYVKKHLKTVCELVNAINSSFSQRDSEEQVENSKLCQDMQLYFNFLDFLFRSSSLIKSITNRQFAICGSLKAFFDQLKPKDNRLLTYILANQDKILENQPIHYYDIYLKIIRQNGKDVENKIEYIYLQIHRLKADKISSQYIYLKNRVVEAIKSYSQIIFQYDRVANNRKDKINKLQIQKKIARLLLVVNLPEEAANIYQKNHLVKSAEKCFKQILQSYHGDDKAKKYIAYGRYFESQLSFPRAIDYYQSAFEAAKSYQVRQQSIKQKIECIECMKNPREEEKRLFVRYYNSQSTEEEFLNSNSAEQGNQGQSNQFSRLRNKLRWDEKAGTSLMYEGDQNDESMIG